MNSALSHAAAASGASPNENGALGGDDNPSEFERVINNAPALNPVTFPLKPGTHTETGAAKTFAPIPPPSSSSLMAQMQDLQKQDLLSPASSGGDDGAVDEGAATTAEGPVTMAMLLERQNSSSQQQQQVIQVDHSNQMNDFHAAFQVPSPAPTPVVSDGGALKDPQNDLLVSKLNPTGAPPPPIANEFGIDSILKNLTSNKGGINAASTNRTKVFHGKGSFPLNLAIMLESVEAMNLSHVISWLPSGQSFVIHNPDQFLALVLPKFFKSSKNTKIRSFYRKLNRWGFSILRNHHLTKQGVGTMKGVWHHPDFFRSRALECLKIALETGDTSSFLTVTHSKTEADEGGALVAPAGVGSVGLKEDPPLAGGNGGSAAGKKRSASSPLSLRSGSATESTDLSQSFFSAGQPHQRASHRESDFSLGDDSTSQNFEDCLLLSQVALQAASSLENQPMTATDNGGAFNLANSFTSGTIAGPVATTAGSNGFNLASSFTGGAMAGTAAAAARNDRFNLASSFTAGSSLANVQADNATSSMNKRGRNSLYTNSTPSTFHQYQPITQSGEVVGSISGRPNMGNNGGRRAAASWSAGSTFSQHDFNFPSASFQISNFHALAQEGRGQNQQLGNNDNVEIMQGLASMGHQENQQLLGVQQDEHENLTSEDVELASFFEKFAESLQK